MGSLPNGTPKVESTASWPAIADEADPASIASPGTTRNRSCVSPKVAG